ncbi:ORF6N domain-containing protein [Candidatus Saganbacteria bacterium]|nr:ORF6N domain-containing protein [Candidatus Saganbacteria bacterium]
MNNLIPVERIEGKIYFLRGQKVMIDRDLAELYDIQTRDLNKAVSRNLDRFPKDFMFQLNENEFDNLMFHFGTSKMKPQNNRSGWGGTRKLPRMFTEQGVAMLSSILRSKKAVEVNIVIMRAFVKLRQIITKNKDLTYLFRELKHKVDQHDVEIGLIIKTIEKMIVTEKKPRKKMGFV